MFSSCKADRSREISVFTFRRDTCSFTSLITFIIIYEIWENKATTRHAPFAKSQYVLSEVLQSHIVQKYRHWIVKNDTIIWQYEKKILYRSGKADFVIMIDAIKDRRSIRRYRTDEVPRPYIEENTKSWYAGSVVQEQAALEIYSLFRGEAKKEMLHVMEDGLNRERINPLLPESRKLLKGAEYTLSIMKQAPVIIFVTNRNGTDIREKMDAEERIYEICNAQSVGAAIENMTLAATELGLGSLWICDTYFAYDELTEWLGDAGALYVALAVGYADENPAPRPRKDISCVTEWRQEAEA